MDILGLIVIAGSLVLGAIGLRQRREWKRREESRRAILRVMGY